METNIQNGAPVAPLPKRSIPKAILDAIKGTEVDYTQIDMRKAIFLLAVPMMLELIMESIFAIADIYFVGKLGASAVATVGLTETYLFLLYSVGMGMSMAVTAIIARRIGEKKKEEAGLSAAQAILLALIISLPFALAGIFFAKDMLLAMGGDEWSQQVGYRYMQWALGGNFVIMLLFVINAIFRGAGDASVAMWVLVVANAFNLVLDPLLIFGLGPIPAMGIEGAAIATIMGRSVGVALQLWMLFKGSKHIRAKWSQFRWEAATMLNIVKTSLGGVGQMIIAMTSWIFIMRILSTMGSEVVAGATIGLRIMMFTMMPAWGLSNAAATLVGQNLGAGHPERAEASVWKTGVYNMIYLVIVSIVYYFFCDEMMALFTKNPDVIAVGVDWLKLMSFIYFIYGWWMVAVQAFNGSGDTKTPTYINVVFFWLIEIPLCYYLAITLDNGHKGVFWGIVLAEASVGLFTLWLFTRGKWKETKV